METTLGIIKPSVCKNCSDRKEFIDLLDDIVKRISEKGLYIKHMKIVNFGTVLPNGNTIAEAFYAVHKHKPFFSSLVKSMSHPCVVIIMYGNNAVEVWREIIGPTNPAHDPEKKTLRGKYGKNIEENGFHGSDSVDSAQREIVLCYSVMG